jgi:eukaryotic-like serine/threonine-protein kinase
MCQAFEQAAHTYGYAMGAMSEDLLGGRIGRYRLLDVLGEGGMGCVYLAHDEQLDRDVALKLLSPELADSTGFRRRLMREARAAAAIDHPAIAMVFDAGEADGYCFIALERVSGTTLGELIDRRELSVERTLAIARTVAEGLAVAHRAGIVHRDLKPDNVMIGADGRVKILDFGVARVLQERAGAAQNGDVTFEGTIVGTPGYMSPEQALGLEVDVRTDVFSFGVLLFEMLTGALPFEGASSREQALALMRRAPPSLIERCPAAGAEVEALVMRCLEKNPEDRFANAGELAIALGQLREPVVLVPVAAPPILWEAAKEFAAPVPPAPQPRRIARAKLIVPAIAGVMLTVAVWAARAPHEEANEAPQPSSSPSSPRPPVRIVDLPAPASERREAVVAFQNAIGALHEGDWNGARHGLARALAIDPGLAPARLRLAILDLCAENDAAREQLRAARAGANRLAPRDAVLLWAIEPWASGDPIQVAESARRLATAAAHRPYDAELRWLLAVVEDQLGQPMRALASAELARQLDPAYAAGWQAIADDTAWRGDCRAFERRARHDALRDPADASAHRALAAALHANGEPIDAVAAELQRADPRQTWLLATVRGDFSAAASTLFANYAVAEKSDDLARWHAALRPFVAVLAESGDNAGVTKLARAFLRHRPGLTDPPRHGLRVDLTPAMLRVTLAAGDVGPATFERELGAWSERWPGSGRVAAERWLYGWVDTARTASEARAALAQRPADFTWLPSAGPDQTSHRARLGEALYLAGERGEAIATLRAATNDCRGLLDPIGKARAGLALGRALADAGDKRGACFALARVAATWPHPRPRSVTADAARSEMWRLRCSKK